MAYLSQTLCNMRQLKIEKKSIYCMCEQKEKTEKAPASQPPCLFWAPG